MRNPLLAAALLLAATHLAPAQTQPTKVKVKSKPGRAAKIPTPPAAAEATTDWSLTYASTITQEDLRQHLSVLASDEYEGRETGQKGQKMAAEYLSKQFAELGLAGPVKDSDNPYIQHFTLSRVGLDPASSVKIGNRTFVVDKDFYLLLRDASTTSATVQPAFVGYGISTKGYADFATGAANLKDQHLVMLLGEPLTKTGQPLLGKAGQPSSYGTGGVAEMTARSPAVRSLAPRSTFRIASSAAAFAQVPQDYKGLFDRTEQLIFPDEPVPKSSNISTNLFIVSPEMGAAMLGTTTAGLVKYQKAVAAAGKPIASPFKPVALTLQAANKRETFTTENVLGYLEGTDKKDEVLVISAHYDHEGIKNGVVYNGADDDGSGTVSVLEMAQAFAQAKKEGHGPRRSILFLANTGEEEGLLGSKYYTDHPVFPLESTVADLNIDMVGRVDSTHMGKGDYLYLVGSDKLSSELHALSEATNTRYNPVALDYKYNDPADPEHIYYRSDHYNFAKHKVPVIFYTSGLHPDYHRPTDDIDKIDFPALTRRNQLIFHTAWELANRDNRVVVDSNKP
ncbi:M28 family peptidase [uncultured Hymenobacter sp.]|uniref:M28 family peptidase n=1 Tax=uncultured Hymenobacter sp. TaxID=170016 RepID=UPI0035CC371F